MHVCQHIAKPHVVCCAFSRGANFYQMRIVSVRQLKPIQLEEGRFVFPLNSCTKIILDKKRPSNKKIHELLHQQGSHYGTVGDCCTYLSNDELLSLEAKGMIAIKKAGAVTA